MPIALLDDYDLDIQLGPIGRPRIDQPFLSGTRPDSEPCCSDWTCPIDCKPTGDC